MPDSAQGAKHPQSYSSDGVTVVDQVSKLEWQIGIPEVLAGCTQFSRPTSGGVGPVGEFCTLEEARRYCDMLVHGGDSDWRLPSTIELASLLDTARDASRFGINSDYFGVPNWSGFVTNSLYPNAPAYYRVVDFVGRTTWQGEYGMVRCVRAGSEPPFATPRDRYQVDAASDTVEDRATGLIWQRTVAETMYTSEQIDAAVPCPADFRLPGPNELLTLVDPTKQQPAIDSDAFPNTPGGSFWASRPSPRNQGVSFEFGDLEEGVSSAYVRCVR